MYNNSNLKCMFALLLMFFGGFNFKLYILILISRFWKWFSYHNHDIVMLVQITQNNNILHRIYKLWSLQYIIGIPVGQTIIELHIFCVISNN